MKIFETCQLKAQCAAQRLKEEVEILLRRFGYYDTSEESRDEEE